MENLCCSILYLYTLLTIIDTTNINTTRVHVISSTCKMYSEDSDCSKYDLQICHDTRNNCPRIKPNNPKGCFDYLNYTDLKADTGSMQHFPPPSGKIRDMRGFFIVVVNRGSYGHSSGDFITTSCEISKTDTTNGINIMTTNFQNGQSSNQIFNFELNIEMDCANSSCYGQECEICGTTEKTTAYTSSNDQTTHYTQIVETGNSVSTQQVKTSNILPTRGIKTSNILPTQRVKTSSILPTQRVITSSILPTQRVKTSSILPTRGIKTSNILPTQGIKTSNILPTQRVKTSNILPTQGVKTSTILPTQGVKTSTILPTQGVKTSTILPTQGIKTSTILPTQRVKTSNILPTQGVKTSTILPTQGVKTSTILPTQGVKTSTILPTQGIKTSTILPTQGVKTSTILPTQGIKTSTILPTQGVKTSTILPTRGIKTSNILPTQGVKTSTILPTQGVKTSTILPTQGVKTSTILPTRGIKTSNILPTQGVTTSTILPTQRVVTSNEASTPRTTSTLTIIGATNTNTTRVHVISSTCKMYNEDSDCSKYDLQICHDTRNICPRKMSFNPQRCFDYVTYTDLKADKGSMQHFQPPNEKIREMRGFFIVVVNRGTDGQPSADFVATSCENSRTDTTNGIKITTTNVQNGQPSYQTFNFELTMEMDCAISSCYGQECEICGTTHADTFQTNTAASSDQTIKRMDTIILLFFFFFFNKI